MTDALVARQPIFDRRLDVVGYELLYRGLNMEHAEFTNADMATSQVILNTFVGFSLDALVGSKKAYINLTRNFFLQKYPIPFPPGQIILEVPEKLQIDDELIAALKTLNQQGYTIALDDVIDPQAVLPLLDIVHMVKVDFIDVDWTRIDEIVHFLQRYNVKLLAEKVETRQMLDQAIQMGFDYFQGYFLSKPNIVQGKQVHSTRLVSLRLLSKLQNEQIEFSELEKIIARDVSLSYKLLKLINSSFFGFPTRVNSIKQAMALLGLRQLRAWLTLFILTDIDDKPRELTTLAMVRANMCELLARESHERDPAAFFLVGLFSVLDVLLDMPMRDILAKLPLAEDISAALLQRAGRLGEALECVEAYEHASWEGVHFGQFLPEQIRDIYLQSIRWSLSLNSALQG